MAILTTPVGGARAVPAVPESSVRLIMFATDPNNGEQMSFPARPEMPSSRSRCTGHSGSDSRLWGARGPRVSLPSPGTGWQQLKSAGMDAAPAETTCGFGMRPSNPPCSHCLLVTNSSSPVSSRPPSVGTPGCHLTRLCPALASPPGHLRRLRKAMSQMQQMFSVDPAASSVERALKCSFPVPLRSS